MSPAQARVSEKTACVNAQSERKRDLPASTAVRKQCQESDDCLAEPRGAQRLLLRKGS